MNSPRHLSLALVPVALLTLGLPACARNDATAPVDAATTEPAALTVQPAEYPLAFASARDVLRDMGFLLDRVDAQSGVITTQPKGTAGFATPWDREQTSASQEVSDFIQRNRRTIRVDAATGDGQASDAADLRASTTPVTLRVSVELSRLHTSGRRVNTLSVTDSTYARDPELEKRNMSTYAVVYAQEPDLAALIVDKIRRRMSERAGDDARP